MRIVVADPPSYTPPYDHALAAALAGRGHDVRLLASPFPFGPVPRPEGYEREELFFPVSGRLLRRAPRSRARVLLKGAEYLTSVRRLVRRIDALAPDVVHVQWLPRPRSDVRWLRPLAERHPTVLTAHDVFPRRPEALPAWSEILGSVGRVVVHSPRAVEQLVEFGLERERLACIRHPAFDAPPAHELRPPQGTTLLFFGLLRSYKGLDVLVRALPAIAAAAPDVRLVVAGDPVEPAAPVQELARELGVAERIEWRLRFVQEAEIAELMDASAAVVLPYRELDSSGVLATALGHRRPAVVTDVGSLGEIVREFGAGLVVAPEDPAALAEACARLLTDREALDAAWRGTEAARQALSWDTAAEEHERLYEALLGRERKAAPATAGAP